MCTAVGVKVFVGSGVFVGVEVEVLVGTNVGVLLGSIVEVGVSGREVFVGVSSGSGVSLGSTLGVTVTITSVGSACFGVEVGSEIWSDISCV